MTARARPPRHLPELVDEIEMAIAPHEGQRFFWFSVPPRHWKTSTLVHGVLKHLLRWPEAGVGYFSHTQPFASKQSRTIRKLATAAQLKFARDSNRMDEWELTTGGGLFARGINAVPAGIGLRLAIVDDPFTNREDASSKAKRDHVFNAIEDDVIPRLTPDGCVFLVHCVAEAEPILLADGSWKPVEQVRPGDRVVSYERGKFTSRLVLAQRQSGIDDILTVKTDRKALRVNAKHPFLLASGQWKPAGSLRAGDRVVVTTAKVGNETPYDPEFVWLFGFLIGDGWVTSWARRNRKPSGTISNSRSWCVCIAKSIYPELNARAVAAVAKYFGRTPKDTGHGYYRIDASAAGRKLLELGLGQGAANKRIPAWVFRLSPSLKRAFLRGYGDADGHQLRKSSDSTRISSVSRALVEDTRLLAISAGIRCGRISSFVSTGTAPNSKAPNKATIFSVAVNFAKAPSETETIISVEDSGVSPVYDLTVDGAENFVAQGYVVHNTRWHPDDAIGRYKKREEWRGVNKKALDGPEETIPLLPSEWGFKALSAIKKRNPYRFGSLYQGNPIPPGTQVFKEPAKFDWPEGIPQDSYYVAYGVDLAYSAKTANDWSVCVRLLKVISPIVDPETGKKIATYFVTDVKREHCDAPAFALALKGMQTKVPGPMLWYAATSELGAGQFIAERIPEFYCEIAKVDKLQRAQRVAELWNLGRVMVPSGEDRPEWVEDFVDELTNFTGVKDAHDDQVDALAAAFDVLDAYEPEEDDGGSDEPEGGRRRGWR